jgi:hypothetical protein
MGKETPGCLEMKVRLYMKTRHDRALMFQFGILSGVLLYLGFSTTRPCFGVFSPWLCAVCEGVFMVKFGHICEDNDFRITRGIIMASIPDLR